MRGIRAIDLFCGAGGSSWGARSAGVEIVAGFDKWELAGQVYKDNFPDAHFYPGDLKEIDPRLLGKEIGKIDLILASPECTNHSPARGGRPRCEESRGTAFHVIRFAEAFAPRWIIIENVVSMTKWHRYKELLGELEQLGWKHREMKLDASHFGVPQARRRLYVVFDREMEPPEVKSSSVRSMNARDVINTDGLYPFSPLRAENRAKATLERADRAIAQLGRNEPFLIVYYGSDHAGGWQTLDRPLRTITTLDRFAYVRPSPQGHVMRMLQPEELKLAMSWPRHFRIRHGSRRDRIRMIGNAVCPKVMRTVVKRLISQSAITRSTIP